MNTQRIHVSSTFGGSQFNHCTTFGALVLTAAGRKIHRIQVNSIGLLMFLSLSLSLSPFSSKCEQLLT